MTVLLMIGGPKNGEFLDIDLRRTSTAHYTELDDDLDLFRKYDSEEKTRPVKIKRHTYNFKKIYTPQDRWIEQVLVYEDVDLNSFTEADLIRFVMVGWRGRKGQKQ